ncbi:hypothetical protein BDV29DRAFT_171862 [Aspergillus leporis]|uniref:Uncharacterized protein n=1 Tax=Aspergillus leporis TaxID=41062 RepID=A0A5N5X454_9EURO|nr:hypothetical protein BDV29DRAFT_171862 [Aspergillus leporis]
MRKYGTKREDVPTFVQSKQNVRQSANFTRQLQVWNRWDIECGRMRREQSRKRRIKHLDNRAALLKRKGLTGNEPLARQNL